MSNMKMSVNGLTCGFHMPPAVKAVYEKDKEGNFVLDAKGRKKQIAQGLPPGCIQKVYKVDEHHCPDNWMHGSGLASSYFVQIAAEKGMWLDFTANAQHTHDVAVLISVQGVNPVDGQSMVEEAFHLKQYRMECPKHNIPFKGDRYCEKCEYKWVGQNYLATTTGQHLWLDGFLTEEGTVAQYYFTENEIKGIAHQLIGEAKKTYSIGVAFYLSKEAKPVVVQNVTRGGYGNYSYGLGLECLNAGDGLESMGGAESAGYYAPKSQLKASVSKGDVPKMRNVMKKSMFPFPPSNTIQASCLHDSGAPTMDYEATASDELGSMHSLGDDGGSAEIIIKNMDIAAGAKINQSVGFDPKDMDYWNPVPAGMIYINYCTEDVVKGILAKGKKDLTKDGEGALAGLILGND